MDSVTYQKILFRTAMCVMACDGEIHDSEVKEMKLAFEQTEYFRDLVFKDELESVIQDFKRDEKKVVMEYFDTIATSSLSPVQKLQVLEIILRIIYADDRVDDNEVHFLTIVKSRLNIPDEIFYKRFGEVRCLHNEHNETKTVPTVNKYLDNLNLPELNNLNEILNQTENIEKV